MQLWKALLIAPLLLTANLQAQIPFYGVYPYLPPYYPGVNYAPGYYPSAYYPQPYSAQPYYPNLPYASGQFQAANNAEAIDDLNRQVQQLSSEVSQLQAELAVAQAQQYQAATAPPPPSSPAEPATPMILVFKNGQQIESQGYAVAGETLWILNRDGSQRIALSNLDVAATQRENLKRGIQFPDVGS